VAGQRHAPRGRRVKSNPGRFLLQSGQTVPAQASTSRSEGFRADVLRGLSQSPKTLPSKYLYDHAGSALFDRITQLPEYYPWRCEVALLERARVDLARLVPPRVHIIEYGAGSLRKMRLLLDALREPATYVPLDISTAWIVAAGRQLAAEYPCLRVRPVSADFSRPCEVPLPAGPRLAFFPGSTIGNFTPGDARVFLSHVRDQIGSGGGLVIGVDLKKDPAILWQAYNDAAGVTAAFNRNVLVRVNREIGGDLNVDEFRHAAPYNVQEGRVEMHLVAQRGSVSQVGGRSFAFRQGESIHTENSYKYTLDEFRLLAQSTGFHAVECWSDDRFSVHYLQAA
jgi:L-histidine N-alpha-methyltransferase